MALAHVRSIHALESAFTDDEPQKHTRQLLRLIRAGDSRLDGVLRSHPLADDWLDYAYQGLKDYFQRSAGFIYCAAPSSLHSVIKVGKTALSPLCRVDALNTEAVIEPLTLLSAFYVHDRHWLELRIHRHLTLTGKHHKKEFFYTSIQEVSELLNEEQSIDLKRLAKFGFFPPRSHV